MVTLASVNDKFLTPFTIISGGSGRVFGILDESPQSGSSTTVFVPPRHIMRTKVDSPVRSGTVIQTRSGNNFIVGENGPSENYSGTLWNSWRLFQPTGLYTWQRRQSVRDPITHLQRDIGLTDPVMIWAAVEPQAQEQFDRGMHVNFAKNNFITNVPINLDDVINNQNVTKVDKLIGLSVGVLT